MKKLFKSSRQLNLFPGGLKKQKYNRGNPLTKFDKLWRIKTCEEIRKAGGRLKDVAIKWGISPNKGRVEYMVNWYKDELGIL